MIIFLVGAETSLNDKVIFGNVLKLELFICKITFNGP